MSTPEEPQLQWATPLPAIVAWAVGGGVMATVAALTSADPAGRFLIGLSAVALFALAALGGVQRPRLAVDGSELVVRTLRGSRSYHRTDIDRIRLVPYPRLGRRVPMLEIDIVVPELRHDGQDDERLLIFGRWDLGTDPRDVFDALTAQGFVPAE